MEYRGMDIKRLEDGFMVVICGDEVFKKTFEGAKRAVDWYLDGVWEKVRNEENVG